MNKAVPKWTGGKEKTERKVWNQRKEINLLDLI